MIPLLCENHKLAEIVSIVRLHLIFIIALLTIYYNRKIIQIKAIQMKLVANIITYRNRPVHLREKVAFTADGWQPQAQLGDGLLRIMGRVLC